MKIQINNNQVYEINSESITLKELIGITEILKSLSVKKIKIPTWIINNNENQNQQINSLIKIKCPRCHSLSIIKNGWRKNLFGKVQKYTCLKCKHRFSLDSNKRMRIILPIRVFALSEGNKDKSARAISKEILKKFKMYVSHTTVSRWRQEK